MSQEIPTKKDQIVRIKSPLADEDPTQLYIVREDPSPYPDNYRIDVSPLNTRLTLIPINRIEKDQLETVPFGVVRGEFPNIWLDPSFVDQEQLEAYRKYYKFRYNREWQEGKI